MLQCLQPMMPCIWHNTLQLQKYTAVLQVLPRLCMPGKRVEGVAGFWIDGGGHGGAVLAQGGDKADAVVTEGIGGANGDEEGGPGRGRRGQVFTPRAGCQPWRSCYAPHGAWVGRLAAQQNARA